MLCVWEKRARGRRHSGTLDSQVAEDSIAGRHADIPANTRLRRCKEKVQQRTPAVTITSTGRPLNVLPRSRQQPEPTARPLPLTTEQSAPGPLA